MNISTLRRPISNRCICGEFLRRRTDRRTDHGHLHVRGYKQEGTTTTPFDMTALNDLDRFHLVDAVIDRVPGLGERATYADQFVRDQLLEHRHDLRPHGQDLPDVRDWERRGRGKGYRK